MRRVGRGPLKGALLVGGVSLFLACQERRAEPPATEVFTAAQVEEYALQPAARKPLQGELRLPGEVLPVPERTTVIRAPVEGTVLAVYGQVGQAVQPGQALLRVRAPELLAAQAQLQSLLVQQHALQVRLQALERMARDSLATPMEVAQVRADFLASQAEAASLRERLALYRPAGEDFLLMAPRAGVLTALRVSAGSGIEKGDTLIVLSDLGVIRLQIYVYPEQVSQLAVGMKGVAYLPNRTDSLFFELKGFLPVLQEDSRTLVAYADVPNPGGRWRPGTFFQANLFVNHPDSAVSVPYSALILDSDQWYVLVYKEKGVWEVRPVRIIARSHGEAFVDEVNPGEKVATQRVLLLYQQLTRTL